MKAAAVAPLQSGFGIRGWITVRAPKDGSTTSPTSACASSRVSPTARRSRCRRPSSSVRAGERRGRGCAAGVLAPAGRVATPTELHAGSSS
jgi:hypothetical protein